MAAGSGSRGGLGVARLTERADILRQLGQQSDAWDVLVIGGGATGLGVAVEAASRGYRTLLVERSDFAKGTSSRSTKLVHGGVRYLEQLNLTLVLDALRERGHMLRNAPHLVHDLSFVVPAYSYFSLPYYGFGLKVYERLSGKLSLGPSQLLSRRGLSTCCRVWCAMACAAAILYHDGQFDDARYAMALLRTLQDLVALRSTMWRLLACCSKAARWSVSMRLIGRREIAFELRAKVVINATGVDMKRFLRWMALRRSRLLALSQGTHFVLPRSFLPGDAALMIPKTADGRVLFAIPWHGSTLVGTTDDAG